MAAEAMVMRHTYTYKDVDALCRRHLADRARIDGAKVVRYERRETQRFRPAYPHVSAYLVERIDFDLAFARLQRRHQEVLIAWYGCEDVTQAELARRWACTPYMVRKLRRQAVEALRYVLNT